MTLLIHTRITLLAILLLALLLMLVGVASAETVSQTFSPYDDGYMLDSVNASFYEVRNAVGDTYGEASSGTYGIGWGGSDVEDVYDFDRRYGFTANTSEILATSTVTAASLCVRTASTSPSTALGSLNLTLVGLTPSNPESLAATDYSEFGTVRYATDFTVGTWGLSQFNCFDFNAAGLDNISKTGYTTLAVMIANSVDNSTTGMAWASGGASRYSFYQRQYTGTAYDPYLNVTWDTPGAPVAAFSASRTTGGTGASIAFTDSSTNIPTSWLWDFGDDNTSTSQSPSHTYAYAGTFTVNLTATNDEGSDSEVKTDYITIASYPDNYMNPYRPMIPWLDQGDQSWCAGFAAANAAMLLRYEELGTAPAASMQPQTRDVWFNWSGNTVQSDTFEANYTPSPASLYWVFDAKPGDHYNYTALAETMTEGYNLATDKITSKYNDTDFDYPQNDAYLDSHFYNKIDSYILQDGGTAATWESLKQNISSNHVVVLMIDTYSNTKDEPTINSAGIPIFDNPTGAATNGHYVAAIGYNSSADEVYFLHSWGEDNDGYNWTKTGGLTKTYWVYPAGASRNAFIVPVGITVDEELPELEPPVASFTANITSGTAPLAVAFTDTSTNTPVLWNWSWGDGNWTNGTTQNPEHTYDFDGIFDAFLIASNAAGSNQSANTTITVGVDVPVASFTKSRVLVVVPQLIAVNDTSSNTPTTWNWSWGDGQWTNTTDSSARNATHRYSRLGYYPVSLTATNAAGSDTTARQWVFVWVRR